jgi:HD-GYP domain-containing protein (c-di-GMP phosphodiesterase class II)
LKPAKLTDEEWDEMRKHPDIGAQILAPVPFLGGACQVVKHHHERVDGGGYPDGLIGDSIPIGARILAVVDSYCAIRDKRVYKDARTHEDAVSELLRCSGQQFDTRVVATFLELIEKKELDIEQVLIQMNEEKSASDGDAKKDGDTEAA